MADNEEINGKESKENTGKIGKEAPGVEKEIKDMKVSYSGSGSASGRERLPQEMDRKAREAMEKTKTELEKLKKEFLKKYPFIRAIGILPTQGVRRFIEEEFAPEEKEKIEKISKRIHLVVIIPEDKFKKVKEIRDGLVKIADAQKQKVWIYTMSHVDVFGYGLDEKFEHAADIGMSYPLYDKDFLASLRVAEFHKFLVLKKFERYIVSYVIAGSFVRGDAVKTSDVDTYVIIDDTDVKRMPRLEIKEKLRGWIHRYIAEASELAQVKNVLNVQVYLLTEFWEAVKDAHPVMFTLIRDGIPLYDRGTFLPWKLLLKMGKLKPSPEAIDMFMASGDKLNEIVKRRLLDIAIGDVYWSILTPSQALIMLYGRAPPTTKETPDVMKEIFYDKERMLEKKHIDFLARIIKLYKDYEHQKVNEVSGKEVDELMKDANDYINRLKDLRKQIEKRAQSKTLKQIYEEVLALLKAIFREDSEEKLARLFKSELVDSGLLNPAHASVLKNVFKFKNLTREKKKLDNAETKQGIEDLRKNASILIRDLVEYRQRDELSKIEKGRFRLKTAKGDVYELILTKDGAFLIDKASIRIIKEKIKDSSEKELSEALAKHVQEKDIKIDHKVFHILERELGEFDVMV